MPVLPTPIDTPTIDALLRQEHRYRTAGGRYLSAWRLGRMFLAIDLDWGDWPSPPFPPTIPAALRPMSDDLATIYVYRRDTSALLSAWDGGRGHLHAPVGAADALLRVLLAADVGDPSPAQTVAPIIAKARTFIEGGTNKAARMRAARNVVPPLTRRLTSEAQLWSSPPPAPTPSPEVAR